MKISFKRRAAEYLFGACIAVISFLVYLATVCPTVNFIDSGELATDVFTLGIAHPTGYPLFTLVGWLCSHIPLGLRSIYQLNVMAAFFCSSGLFFFFRFLVFFINEFGFRNEKKNSTDETTLTGSVFLQVFVPAIVGSLWLGFSETYWSQALAIEVYSLHVFFLATVLYLFTKAIQREFFPVHTDVREDHRPWYWYGFAFALGLAFTNHMTTILLAPGFIFLYFFYFRFSRDGWRRILQMSVPFLLGLSLYFYLPLRAATHPLMNWGNPVTFDKFFTHFTGKVYRVWLFSSTAAAGKQLKYFFDTLPSEFVYFPYLFSIIGVWNLYRERRSIFFATLILFVGCVLYSINYDIHDIDSYFLLAYLMIALWSAVGVRALLIHLKNRTAVKALAGVLLCSCGILVSYHYNEVDESKTLLVEDYTKDMFNSIGQNGIIISYQWDYFVSAAYYFQLVENFRPDVVVIDKELLRRSWYYAQLERRYPWLIAQSKKEVDALLIELYKFEHNIPYNSNVIEYRYAAVIRSFVEKNYASRPVYVSEELEPQYTTGWMRVPSGLTLRLFNDNSYRETAVPEFHFHKPLKTNKYIEGIFSLYLQSYFNNALYRYYGGKSDEALTCIEKALSIDPNFQQALLLRDKIESQLKK